MSQTEFYFRFPRVGNWGERKQLEIPIPPDAIKSWRLNKKGKLYDANDNSESVFRTIRDHYCVMDAALIAQYYREQEKEDVDKWDDSRQGYNYTHIYSRVALLCALQREGVELILLNTCGEVCQRCEYGSSHQCGYGQKIECLNTLYHSLLNFLVD